MNLDQIHYIIAIAETGSLSMAAQRLGVSQPALSKYLSKLEQTLRLELFYREKKKLKLTQAGRIYLEAAHKILSIQQQTRASLAELSGSQKRKRLNVGVTPHQGAQIVARLYPIFNQRYPGIEFVFHESYTQGIYDALRRNDIDYGITTELSDTSGLRLIPLFKEELLLSVPAFHNLAALSSGEPERMVELDLAEFQDAPFVLMDLTTTIGQISKAAFERAGFQPTVVFRSPNGYIVDQMIRSGLGVGLIPYHYAVPSKDVVYFRLPEPCAFCCCAAVKSEHRLSEEERYLTYLQLKDRENDPNIQFCWGPELRALVDEFDMTERWTPAKKVRD